MASFDTFGRGVADSAGTATAVVPGPPPGQQWRLVRISVTIPTVTTTQIIPCRVYRNLVSPSTQVSATRTGQLDTDDNPQVTLSPGEQLVIEWQDAPPGAQCTAIVGYDLNQIG